MLDAVWPVLRLLAPGQRSWGSRKANIKLCAAEPLRSARRLLALVDHHDQQHEYSASSWPPGVLIQQLI